MHPVEVFAGVVNFLLLVEEVQAHFKRGLRVHKEEQVRDLSRLERGLAFGETDQVLELEITLPEEFPDFAVCSHLSQVEAVDWRGAHHLQDGQAVAVVAILLTEEVVGLRLRQLLL